MDFPGGSAGKESACNVGALGSIPGLGRSPGEGNDNPFQYSCLENPKDQYKKVHDNTRNLGLVFVKFSMLHLLDICNFPYNKYLLSE